MDAVIYKRAEDLIHSAAQKGITIATAESCTGGGIGQALTAIPGSSSVFLGGIIAYSNDVKAQVLNVPEDMLKTHGAVSEQTAKLMADNARSLLKSDIAVSVTGIAGPGGGTKTKPVGLVYIGLSQTGVQTYSKTLLCKEQTRESVRNQTIIAALEALLTEVRTR